MSNDMQERDVLEEDYELLNIFMLFKKMVDLLKENGLVTIYKDHLFAEGYKTYGFKFESYSSKRWVGDFTKINLNTNVGKKFEEVFGSAENE